MKCDRCYGDLVTDLERLWGRCEACLGCKFPRAPVNTLRMVIRDLLKERAGA